MNGTKTKVRDGTGDNSLRDTIRFSGQTMVISDSGGPYGLRATKEIGQDIKQRRRYNPVNYVFRAGYLCSFAALLIAGIHWG